MKYRRRDPSGRVKNRTWPRPPLHVVVYVVSGELWSGM